MMAGAVPLATTGESKTSMAYRLLEEMIVTMQLKPGALLSEVELAAQLGLGRTPVREALQRLELEYLVEIMPRRGVRVTDIDIKRQLRLLEVRRQLEQLNAALAARRASQSQRASFAAVAEQMTAVALAGDYLGFVHLDREFNTLQVAAAGNEFSANMLRQLHGLSRRFWHSYYRHEQDLPVVAELHAAIARAIAAGDEGDAIEACLSLMDYIAAFTRAALD